MAGDSATSDIPVPGHDELARRFREWAEVDGRGYAPLYERMALTAADDPDLTAILAAARPGQRRPVMFFAAIHELLLEGVDHELRTFFPNVTPEPGTAVGDPGPTLADFCREYRDRLIDVVSTRRIQTNEVSRCLALLPVLRRASAALGGPVGLVEIGASAGLNLLWDRYEYHYAGLGVAGVTDSPVQLHCNVIGDHPPPALGALPEVPVRVGIDAEPMDPTDPDDARWLEACTFPEQPERAHRLREALKIAAHDPPRVVTGGASDVLDGVVAEIPDDLPLCLWDSWTLTYFPRERRRLLYDVVEKLAHHRPLVWASFEAPGTAPRIDPPPAEPGAPAAREFASVVGMLRWIDGEPVGRTLARSHPHVTWLEWFETGGG